MKEALRALRHFFKNLRGPLLWKGALHPEIHEEIQTKDTTEQ
jgi:hypothetical protein